MRPVTITESDGTRKQIGHVDGTTFISVRDPKKHMYKGGQKTLAQAKKDKTAAWGIDEKALNGMLNDGIKTIRIVAGNSTYEIPLREMKFHPEAFVLHHKPHRTQWFLPIHAFEITKG